MATALSGHALPRISHAHAEPWAWHPAISPLTRPLPKGERSCSMDDPSLIVVTPRIAIPRRELKFSFLRSSGPGGQNVNKVNSKAVLRWPVAKNRSLPEDVRARFL